MSGTASVATQFQGAVTATGLQLDNNFSQLVSYLNDPTNRTNYGTDGGTTNTLVINPSPPVVGGYSAGLTITFRAAFTNNGAVVANVSGIGNASVLDQQGRQLTSSAIVSGSVYQMAHNGTSAFNILSPNNIAANAPTATTYEAAGTYTFTAAAGVVWQILEAVGGGGGGGNTGTGPSAGGGGGAGAYAMRVMTSPISTCTITVGAAGAGGAGPTSGGATSIGSFMLCSGGIVGGAGPVAGAGAPGLGGTATLGTLNVFGAAGSYGAMFIGSATVALSGAGANSIWGAGGVSVTTASGAAAKGWGAGGGGGAVDSGAGVNGGAGAPGRVSIIQYFAA